jgi:glycosyltransferase involved in cell wall biosynthesis
MQEPCLQTRARLSSPPVTSKLAVAIPAYRPSPDLVDLVRALLFLDWAAVIVVDDGSGPESEPVFRQVISMPRVELRRHAVNLGKGAALKTAINFALCTHPEASGVVTMDADGQHDPNDVRRVAEEFHRNPSALVLGVRDFSGCIPLRSKLGNRITRQVLRATVGQKLADSQTGLRAIPRIMLSGLLHIQASGYEFEMEMLLLAKFLEVKVVEQPIRTIYKEGNKSSHFRPVLDSMRIYWVLVRFVLVALLSAIVDNAAFCALFWATGNLLQSQVAARVASLLVNYPAVRARVFCSHERHRTLLPKYLLLVGVNIILSYFGVRLLTRLSMSVLLAKLLADGFLFLVSFLVQRGLVFVKRSIRPKNL